MTPEPALAFALRAGVRVLDAAGVPFALAGGLAIGVWGRRRSTVDVDLMVLVEGLDALTRLVEEAQPEGFLALDPRPMLFRRALVGRLLVDPDQSGVSDQPVIVDLIRPVGQGADKWLGDIIRRRVFADVLDLTVPIVSPEDLVLAKLLVEQDRGYDLEDARSVVRSVADALDRDYLTATARVLGVQSELSLLLA